MDSNQRPRSYQDSGLNAVDQFSKKPLLDNTALDQLTNASYQIVIEVSSYRERQSPHRALLGAGREGGG